MSTKLPVRCEQIHPVLHVEDVKASAAFYQDMLGFEIAFQFDPPTIAGVNLDKVSLHLLQGTPNPTGQSIYFVVSDVDLLYQRHKAAGVLITTAIGDRSYGLRDFSVQDNSGYELSFGQHCVRREPKLPIERAPLETRIERRLLAVVEEIAASKDMTVAEMLEETLLHTFEATPDGGVASPHTQATLELIDRLKKKHGIDYETHDSYRLVEDARTGDSNGVQ